MEFAFENVQAVTDYIQIFGLWAPLVAFVLFVVQAALPVFPYIILAVAGGILFGFKMGVFLSWSGALTGACLAFVFSHWVGYNWIVHLMKKRFHHTIPEFNPATAFWSIVLARIVPVVPTPLINVAAALSGISFLTFFTSSALGKIPSAVLYTGLGLALFNTSDIQGVLYILAAFLLIVLFLRYLSKRFSRKRMPS
ncbi:MAG: TVP38/TMEM64 family protein [Bacillota bacterium]|nr:TVP38/TMEM64 family protein [Bacillota bacterium]